MKNKYILYLDTSSSDQVLVALYLQDKKIRELSAGRSFTSQVVLPLIEQILQKEKITPKDLSEIKVFEGPGSFTGLRVGAAVANTLSWLLQIPVNGKMGKIVEPKYQ